MSRFPWKGTVVARPSGWRYCRWDPRWRASRTPSRSSRPTTSRGLRTGARPTFRRGWPLRSTMKGRVRMRIGIIGAGNMGRAIARHFIRLGHNVSIANSKGPESLTALAAEIGAAPVSVVDAANAGEIVIIAIPTKAILDLPRTLFANVPSSVVVIDIGNYHPQLRDGRIDTIERPVIKAFNNILAKSLLEKGVPRGTAGRIALSVVGDSSDAKAAVLRLVDDLGFDPVDGGDLDNSWRQQPGTPAYCRDLGADALRRALAEAEPSRIAEYRAEEEARIKRYIAAQTARGSARH